MKKNDQRRVNNEDKKEKKVEEHKKGECSRYTFFEWFRIATGT